MSSNNEYEHQKYWIENNKEVLNKAAEKFINEKYKEELLKEINLPKNIKKLNEFFKSYRVKHSKYNK